MTRRYSIDAYAARYVISISALRYDLNFGYFTVVVVMHSRQGYWVTTEQTRNHAACRAILANSVSVSTQLKHRHPDGTSAGSSLSFAKQELPCTEW